jgi:hypothetical protein
MRPVERPVAYDVLSQGSAYHLYSTITYTTNIIVLFGGRGDERELEKVPGLQESVLCAIPIGILGRTRSVISLLEILLAAETHSSSASDS